MSTHPRRAAALAGLRDSIPLLVGAMPFGLIFGVSGLLAGLSPAAVLGLSLIVFAGSSQFIAVQLVAQGAALPVIWLTTFVVNVRHSLYSLTLGPHLKRVPTGLQAALAFWLTDETFAVSAARVASHGPAALHWYMLGSSVGMYVNWFTWTLAGVLLANALNPAMLRSWGLDFAMVVTFIGIVVPAVKNRPTLGAVLAAGVTAVVARGLPFNLELLMAVFVGVGVGVWLEARLPRPVASATTEEVAI